MTSTAATVATVATSSPLCLESGGRKPGCAPFAPSPEWVVVSAEGLPNPHRAIQTGKLDDELPLIQAWIARRAPEKYVGVVKKIVGALERGKHVRVQCAGGKHRSYALVEAVAKVYTRTPLAVVHRDRSN